VRTPPPANYQSIVTDYFDIMMPRPASQRRLTFGDPERSDCALYGAGGVHRGWMIPVIYDTTVPVASPVRGGSSAKRAARGRTSASGTTAAAAGAATTVEDGVASATLEEVQISGKGYYFWFSRNNIAAVTRRPNDCPP
jgi:hypothetical protein